MGSGNDNNDEHTTTISSGHGRVGDQCSSCWTKTGYEWYYPKRSTNEDDNEMGEDDDNGNNYNDNGLDGEDSKDGDENNDDKLDDDDDNEEVSAKVQV